MIYFNNEKYYPKKGEKGWYISHPFIIISKEYTYDEGLNYEGFLIKEITDKRGKKVPIIGLKVHDCSGLKCEEICKLCGKFISHDWEDLPPDKTGEPKKCKKCGLIKYFHRHNFINYNHKSACVDCGFMVDGEYGNNINFDFKFLPSNWEELVKEAKEIRTRIKNTLLPKKPNYIKFWEGVYGNGYVDEVIKDFLDVPDYDYYKVKIEGDKVVILGATEAEISWSIDEIEYLGTSYSKIMEMTLEELKQKIKFLTKEDLQKELDNLKNEEKIYEQKFAEINMMRTNLKRKIPKELYKEFMVIEVIAWNDDPYEKHWGCISMQPDVFILMIDKWVNKFKETGEIKYYRVNIKKDSGIQIKN